MIVRIQFFRGLAKSHNVFYISHGPFPHVPPPLTFCVCWRPQQLHKLADNACSVLISIFFYATHTQNLTSVPHRHLLPTWTQIIIIILIIIIFIIGHNPIISNPIMFRELVG